MPETPQTQKEVSELTTRVANIEHMVRFSLASSLEAKRFAREHFESKKNSARLYLALQQPQSQDQLETLLALSQATISKLCTHLEEQGFISRDRDPASTRGRVFRWNDVERNVGLSKIAREFDKRPKK